jgi:hypothetical protein
MATTATSTVLIGSFAEPRAAEGYVDELRKAGFKNEQIGVVRRDEEATEVPAEEGAAAGAITGGVLGAVAGAVATGLIPGVGPVIATGLLTGLLGGAATGATAGGIVGALIGMGLPEDEAHRYEGDFHQGRTLVVVQGNGRLAEAAAILRRSKEPA